MTSEISDLEVDGIEAVHLNHVDDGYKYSGGMSTMDACPVGHSRYATTQPYHGDVAGQVKTGPNMYNVLPPQGYGQQTGIAVKPQRVSVRSTAMETEWYDNVQLKEETPPISHSSGGIKAAVDPDTRIPTKQGPIKTMTHKEFISLEYNTKHKKRGRAIIINNVVYANKQQRYDRDGSERDASRMEHVLKTLLFEPINRSGGSKPRFIFNDQTTNDVREIMRDAADGSINDFSDYDCLVVVILSYGIEGAVMCCDGATDEFIKTSEIMEYFKADRCPSLVMKPKLFLAQLCPAITYDIPDSIPSRGQEAEKITAVKKFPREADILLHYCTIPGTFGWFSEDDRGLSWYIQCLSKALMDYCTLPIRVNGKSQNMMTVITRVNQLFIRVMKENGLIPDRQAGVPLLMSTFTKHLTFHKKENE